MKQPTISSTCIGNLAWQLSKLSQWLLLSEMDWWLTKRKYTQRLNNFTGQVVVYYSAKQSNKWFEIPPNLKVIVFCSGDQGCSVNCLYISCLRVTTLSLIQQQTVLGDIFVRQFLYLDSSLPPILAQTLRHLLQSSGARWLELPWTYSCKPFSASFSIWSSCSLLTELESLVRSDIEDRNFSLNL